MCRLVAGSVLGIVFVVLSGCGGNSASVTGTVLLQGTRVKNGSVTFAPVSQGSSHPGTPVSGAITAEGEISVTGATPGRNRVTFAPAHPTNPITLKPGQSVKVAYEGLSPREMEVELKPGSNTINIDLVRVQSHH